MKRLAKIAALFSLIAAPLANAQESKTTPIPKPLRDEIRQVAPVLEKYAEGHLKELWQRGGLTPRDRSIVTLAALIARNLTVEMHHHIGQALDNGVKPAEISEIITHLAFYSGWGNAMSVVAITKDVFADRDIEADQLARVSAELLPLDKEAEAERQKRVAESYGAVSPGTIQYTTDILFLDLWLRPDLAPRDRSLVTVSALISSGQIAQVSFHLNKAMDNGLTQEEAGEMITQLAFYAGWPKAFSAMSVAKDVFEKREK